MEQVAASGGRRTTYDARGLAEPVAEVPHVSEIDGATAVFDAAKLTTRQINLELRSLIYEQGIRDVTVRNPGAKHSIGVGFGQAASVVRGPAPAGRRYLLHTSTCPSYGSYVSIS